MQEKLTQKKRNSQINPFQKIYPFRKLEKILQRSHKLSNAVQWGNKDGERICERKGEWNVTGNNRAFEQIRSWGDASMNSDCVNNRVAEGMGSNSDSFHWRFSEPPDHCWSNWQIPLELSASNGNSRRY